MGALLYFASSSPVRANQNIKHLRHDSSLKHSQLSINRGWQTPAGYLSSRSQSFSLRRRQEAPAQMRGPRSCHSDFSAGAIAARWRKSSSCGLPKNLPTPRGGHAPQSPAPCRHWAPPPPAGFPASSRGRQVKSGTDQTLQPHKLCAARLQTKKRQCLVKFHQ